MINFLLVRVHLLASEFLCYVNECVRCSPIVAIGIVAHGSHVGAKGLLVAVTVVHVAVRVGFVPMVAGVVAAISVVGRVGCEPKRGRLLHRLLSTRITGELVGTGKRLLGLLVIRVHDVKLGLLGNYVTMLLHGLSLWVRLSLRL